MSQSQTLSYIQEHWRLWAQYCPYFGLQASDDELLSSKMAPTISPRGTQVIAWAYAMFSLAAIIVFLRIFVRSTVVRVVGREDLIITIALVCPLEEATLNIKLNSPP